MFWKGIGKKKAIRETSYTISARMNFSGGSEVHQGRACKGGRRVGVPGCGAPPRTQEKFSENL